MNAPPPPSPPPSFPCAVPETYTRFIVNSIRKEFELFGTPIRLTVRAPENPYLALSRGTVQRRAPGAAGAIDDSMEGGGVDLSEPPSAAASPRRTLSPREKLLKDKRRLARWANKTAADQRKAAAAAASGSSMPSAPLQSAASKKRRTAPASASSVKRDGDSAERQAKNRAVAAMNKRGGGVQFQRLARESRPLSRQQERPIKRMSGM